MLFATPRVLLACCLVTTVICAALPGQSGRTLTVDQPPQLGQMSQVEVSYPSSAVGNAGLFVIAGHLAGTTAWSLPGWTTVGSADRNSKGPFPEW